MKLSKSMFGVAAAALVVSACERRNAAEARGELGGLTGEERSAKPLKEPTLSDLEPSAEDVSPTEAAGLAVAVEAVGDLRSTQREIQLACVAAQDALNQAQFATGTEWADAKLRAEHAIRRAYQAVIAADEDVRENFPEVKGEVKGTPPRAR